VHLIPPTIDPKTPNDGEKSIFVHAADLHLDTPFEGVAGPAPF
jgi:hypothetical protein